MDIFRWTVFVDSLVDSFGGQFLWAVLVDSLVDSFGGQLWLTFFGGQF
jgi:hypothetical protein